MVVPGYAGSYRAKFILGIAFSNAVALFGFVGFFLAGEWWTYAIGVALAFVGFVVARPTRTSPVTSST